MKFTVSVIYGSVRSHRKGIMAARYLEKELLKRDITVHFIDPLDYKLPLLDKMYKEYEEGSAPQTMSKLSEILKASDGFLIVTGEYNNGIPPALKNLLDHFQREYFFKPSAIASYSAGAFGGVRAAVHMRIITGELGMPAISSMLPIPKIGGAFDEDFNPTNEITPKATKKFLDEFMWYLEAYKRQRELGLPY
jgi:NAD(P)H-dependent FMN reductase